MNRIRLLSEQVANQIAAGEVVERPASVVKELVENALDAQSTRLTVEIQAGGRSLIRITDDGVGMSRDDALMCLERHATSKIQKAEDLQSIATMGFRGEALPSIASVSRFTLTTRERQADSPEGTQVIVNGGKIVEVKAAGSAPGTVVEARSLFFNLPARRKFLRSEETEAAHIQHYLMLAALAHPRVAFTFIKDGRTVWQLPCATLGEGAGSEIAALRERMRQLAGTLPQMIAFDATGALHETIADAAEFGDPGETSRIRIWGLIGAPGVSRSSREEQRLFVNRRPVENRTLNYALIEGYHTALMKGRYPVCCLFLEVDPAAVDVNIHPAKREVKFRDERALRGFVTNQIRQALLTFHRGAGESQAAGATAAPEPPRRVAVEPTVPVEPAPELPLPGVPPAREPVSIPKPASLPLSFRKEPAAVEPSVEPPASFAGAYIQARAAQHGMAMPDAGLPAETEPAEPVEAVAPTPRSAPVEAPAATAQVPPQGSGPVPLLAVPLRIVGVIGKLYVLMESDRGLVLLDQHAAHERILFEQMLERVQRGEVASQRLLLPETIELSPRDALFVRGILELLTRLGVGLSEFGERTFLLDALPPFVKSTEPRNFVLGFIDELKKAGDGVNAMRLGEDVVAKTVCRHAVKANDPLSGPELEHLVRDLRRCTMPYTCPHGRPTLIEMSYRELEKKFGRAQ